MIVHDGPKIYDLPERAAEMVRFIISRADTISETPNLKVEHNCAPNRIQSRLTTFDSEAKVMES